MFYRPRKLIAKFMLGIGVILFCAVGLISFLFYENLKDLYIKEAYQKTELVLGHIEATMEYVRDELRPQMYHVLQKDAFVREAMSTSFVNKGIMDRFVRIFPDYIYRRVALDPMNPKNRTDGFETALLGKFSAAGSNTPCKWKGIIKKDGRKYFAYFRGVRMERQCEPCHGDPAHAPASLLLHYGRKNGHYWKTGQIIGLESIAIPIDETFNRMRQVAFSIFLIGIAGMAALFLVLNYLYYLIAVRPIKKTSAFFKSVAGGQKGLDSRFDLKGDDEISELAESFNRMILHLKKSQEDLRASEVKYRQIFEGSKDAIIVTDCTGLVLDINNSGVELLGAKGKGDIVNRLTLYDFMAGKEAVNRFLGLMEDAGFAKDFEAVFRRGDGGEASVLLAANMRKESESGVCGYECIVKDITERKKIEEQIRQADKLASIGQLAAGVAHEINNPLSIVLGYTGLAMKEAPPRMKEDLSLVQGNARLCKKIVEDLLDFSRQTKSQCERADINASVESIVQVVEGKFGEDIAVKRDYGRGLPQVTIDKGKMKQVYMNILMNAYQSMGSGGTITVSTRHDAGSGRVAVSFADTGCGIPRDIQGRIFEPFFTTKEPGKGTGLGLAVSYGIIKEHNGEITFESTEGKGAVFTVWLPVGEGKG
ncbi:MAG: DUF3365 domain-containing protein [Nitrospiraceae bacterium]|nr:DUF3365 domain-containing protein [Nitrospiraceae bacterium]